MCQNINLIMGNEHSNIWSTLWNGLPESLRNIKSIGLFKENYKTYIKPKVFKTNIFFSSIIILSIYYLYLYESVLCIDILN